MSNSPQKPLKFDKSLIPPKPQRSFVFVKLLAALIATTITILVGLGIGIYSLRQPFSWLCLPQRMTIWPKMGVMIDSIKEYKEEKGSFPRSVEEIYQFRQKPGSEISFEEWSEYFAVDYWKHPLVYRSDGKTWELLSYGADHRPGGIGIDADFHCSDSSPTPQYGREHVPRIRQVVTSKEFQSTIAFCALTGFVMFFILFFQLFIRIEKKDILKTVEISRENTGADQRIRGLDEGETHCPYRLRYTYGEIVAKTIGLTLACLVFVAVHITLQSVASGH